MPRAPKAIKRPAHRPQKAINWDLVDSLLEAGCPGTEIAPHFDMHCETFYDRVQIEKGMGFTEYSQQKRSKGASELRAQQHLKALGKTDLGDNTLLIFLGKVRLEQRETQTIEVSPESVQTMAMMVNHLNKLQENGGSKALKKEIQNEVESFGDELEKLKRTAPASEFPDGFGKID